jgi:rod shape determining protein RodA
MASIAAQGLWRSLEQDRARGWRRLDLTLLSATAGLALLGVVMVHSATSRKLAAAGLQPDRYLHRQATWVMLGVAAMAVTTMVDYRRLRRLAPMAYVAVACLLVLVLSPLGSTTRGAQAWFQLGGYQFQPSEYAKLALLVILAGYLARPPGPDGFGLRRLGGALALGAGLVGLVCLQPDVGTAMVLVVVAAGMFLVAGARARHLVALCLMGAVAAGLMARFGALEQYQLDRLGAFVDREGSSPGAAYNADQSEIAIGAGRLTGRGLYRGSQTNLSYVPEQHTDFIFTVVGEEMGLLGAGALLSLFALVVWRTWRAAALAHDRFGTLLCAGVLCMLTFQVFQNVGMTMGIMPITGIPLPLVSYGGSSVVAAFAAVGLVLNVQARRFA